MSVLLANVGNSDLKLRDKELLPAPPNPEDKEWWTVRRKGEEIRKHFDRYKESLEMPLIGPTLNWLFRREGVHAKDLHIHLFASDQPQQDTPESEWLKDTAPAAEVIQKLLTYKFEIPQKQVHIHHIEGNPADYANALNFYAKQLPQIAKKADGAQIYLEISGGTPAMTAMLVVVGVEVFGKRARTVYMSRDADAPYEVAIAHELFARQSRAALRTQVEMYAYAVARRTLADAGQLITSDEKRRQLLDALLDYADRRLAFDFARACAALEQAHRHSIGEIQSRIDHWLRELKSSDNMAVKLAELIHSTRIKQRFGDYADLVQRLFRFQEAVFRHMCLQMGVQFSGDNDQYISDSWRKGNEKLDAYLNSYRRDNKGNRLPVNKPGCFVVDTSRPMNRYSLGAIVDYYVEHVPAWQHWQGTAETLHGLSTVADLRNKGLSGHGFEGIGKEDIEQAYGRSMEDLLDHLMTIYSELFKREPGDNPYDAINDLILNLVGKGE